MLLMLLVVLLLKVKMVSLLAVNLLVRMLQVLLNLQRINATLRSTMTKVMMLSLSRRMVSSLLPL
jgi:hypothetical protein